MHATARDHYAGVESNIAALARRGRWTARVSFDPPGDDGRDRGIIRIHDAGTRQLLEVIADGSGLAVWVNRTDGEGREWLTGRTSRPVRQGEAVRAVRRAVELWRAGGRIADGSDALAELLARKESSG